MQKNFKLEIKKYKTSKTKLFPVNYMQKDR